MLRWSGRGLIAGPGYVWEKRCGEGETFCGDAPRADVGEEMAQVTSNEVSERMVSREEISLANGPFLRREASLKIFPFTVLYQHGVLMKVVAEGSLGKSEEDG